MSPRRMLVATMLVAITGGCGARRPPPGPDPIPAAWSPARTLRARIVHERSVSDDSADVVLDDRDGLAPEEAALLAVDNNPRLVVARTERGLAESELIRAGILPNPRLEGWLGAPTGGNEAVVLGYGVGLSWNVSPLLAVGARTHAAREHVQSVELDIAWQEWQAAQGARLHTLRAIYLEQELALAEAREERTASLAESLAAAREAGAVTDVEVARAARLLADARVARLDAARAVVEERAALNLALGVEPDVELRLAEAPALRDGAPAPEALSAELPERRLDLLALAHAHASSDLAIEAATLAAFPPIEIGILGGTEVDTNSTLGGSLSVGLPFFDRNQDQIAAASAGRARAGAQYEARLAEARADVFRISRTLALVAEQLDAARDAATGAERLSEQARAAAVSGTLSYVAALDLFERSFEAARRAIALERTLAELRVALSIASGRPL